MVVVVEVVVVVVVVVGVVLVVVVVERVCVKGMDALHVCSIKSEMMALRSLKSATVKTVLCSPGGDAMPRSSSSLMSLPIPSASHAHDHSLARRNIVFCLVLNS